MSRSRCTTDEGFTLAMTMVVMALTLALVGVAVGMALAGLSHSERARSVERAQAAADAGADIAGYRMNKTLLAPASSTLLGLVGAGAQLVGCTGVDLSFGSSPSVDRSVAAGDAYAGANAAASVSASSYLRLIPASSNFCQTTQTETLDDGASFRYAISTGLRVGPGLTAVLNGSSVSLGSLVVRQVAAIGTAGGVTRRVIVTYWLDPAGVTAATRLFMKRRYIRCPSLPIDTVDPFADCPQNPGY